MAQLDRPRRSILYMPGSNARAQEKAKGIQADGFIFDLEDAVAPDAKLEARKLVCETVKNGGFGKRELVIRANGLDTPWGRDDIAAASAVGPDAILVPKIESAAMVREIEGLMKNAPAKTAIWCMVETPKAILHAEEIASASDRLAVLVMGTSDLVKDTHARHTPMRLPMLTSLSICMLAARAYGLAILDGVYLELKNEQGFRDTCQQGLELGFDGKTLIHPSQVEPANDIFGPTAQEIDEAKKIIEAFTAAEKEGKGVVVVDGKMIENLHVDNAKRVLALDSAIRELAAG